eukprot:CAMPEP_0172607654 /NCGR_PEP_ID=MMETSP1068-20121228/27803_1 /TAXON_ID=35684 /ORGANISM="Pseudopedinella elastica, Strain CCMP716" /LENGTH=76 /DNA_ID=CAMNT_0013410719 /DNA_START=273 /DNA_END=504 /DNA_ORIENTATION=-
MPSRRSIECLIGGLDVNFYTVEERIEVLPKALLFFRETGRMREQQQRSIDDEDAEARVTKEFKRSALRILSSGSLP